MRTFTQCRKLSREVAWGLHCLQGGLMEGQTAGETWHPAGLLNGEFGEKNYGLRTLEFILWIINGFPLGLFWLLALQLGFSAGEEAKSNCSLRPLKWYTLEGISSLSSSTRFPQCVIWSLRPFPWQSEQMAGRNLNKRLQEKPRGKWWVLQMKTLCFEGEFTVEESMMWWALFSFSSS